MTTWVHHYVSTACEHAVGENRPELHARCRLSCKFAEDGAESCQCPCHTGTPPEEMPPVWVDQARNVARQLLAAIDACDDSRSEALGPDLEQRIDEDPHLFWLRGEEAPRGTRRPPGEDPK